MKTLLNVGHYSINVFGLFIALGMLAGYFIATKEAKRKNYDMDTITNIILYAIISGIVGARLYYVIIFNLDYYLANPIKILAFRDGGLSIQGALIGGALAAISYARIKKINIWKAADIMAPGIILGQAIGRVGCDVFGIAMTKSYSWGMLVNGQLLHPAQIYESILNYILFGILWARRKSTKYDGQLFFIYLVGFSINRFIIEFFRTNPMVIGPLSVAHVTSIALVVISFIAMGILKKKYPVENLNEEKIFDISIKEIIIVLLMIAISIVLYYKWIWV